MRMVVAICPDLPSACCDLPWSVYGRVLVTQVGGRCIIFAVDWLAGVHWHVFVCPWVHWLGCLETLQSNVFGVMKSRSSISVLCFVCDRI